MGDDNTSILGNNRIEDVRWLCSLSESELDLLIGLKMLVLQRAKRIGHESLAKHFDLKMLRGLSFTMMEYLKEQLKDSSVGQGFAESSKCLDESNCSKLHVTDGFSSMSCEELWLYICPDKRKRILDMRMGLPNKREKLTRKDIDNSVESSYLQSPYYMLEPPNGKQPGKSFHLSDLGPYSGRDVKNEYFDYQQSH